MPLSSPLTLLSPGQAPFLSTSPRCFSDHLLLLQPWLRSWSQISSHPFSPWNRQANKNPAADSIKHGIRQTWLAAGMCVYHPRQDSESIQESRFPTACPMLVAPIDFLQATTGKIPHCGPSSMTANYGGCSPKL